MLTSSSVRIPTGFLSPSSPSPASSSFTSFTPFRRLKASFTKSYPSYSRCSSLRFQERSSSESTQIEDALGNNDDSNTTPFKQRKSTGGEEEEVEVEVSGIQVPRQKYIPISKSQLLDAIVLVLLEDDGGGVEEFIRLSSCLDSILHAEHKLLLEDMRVDYASTHCGDKQGSDDEGRDAESEGEVRMGLDYGLEELRKLLLGYSGKKVKANSRVDSRFVDLMYENSLVHMFGYMV